MSSIKPELVDIWVFGFSNVNALALTVLRFNYCTSYFQNPLICTESDHYSKSNTKLYGCLSVEWFHFLFLFSHIDVLSGWLFLFEMCRTGLSTLFGKELDSSELNLLKTKPNLLYIRNQFVPRSKHFPPRL